MIRKFTRFIRSNLKRECLVTHVDFNPVIRQRRVLICYLDYTYACKCVSFEATHTNVYEYFVIIRYFIDANYIVDLCSCNANLNYSSIKDYDIIFGFGNAFFEAARKCPMAKLILYLTENPFYISFQREKERLEYLYQRRNVKFNMERTGLFFKKDDEKNVDAIICLGEKKYVEVENKIVERLYPSGFLNCNFEFKFEKKKKNVFLILASTGFVHKGYDILFEVVTKHPEWTIHYCGEGLLRQLKKIKMKKPQNVVDHGFVDIHSEKFLRIVEETTFVVQPSCSEASSTALLTAMRHGIIPITTRGNGLDELESYMFLLDDYRIETIETMMIETSQMSIEKLEKLARKDYLFANKKFTIENFKNDFFNCMDNVVDRLDRRI